MQSDKTLFHDHTQKLCKKNKFSAKSTDLQLPTLYQMIFIIFLKQKSVNNSYGMDRLYPQLTRPECRRLSHCSFYGQKPYFIKSYKYTYWEYIIICITILKKSRCNKPRKIIILSQIRQVPSTNWSILTLHILERFEVALPTSSWKWGSYRIRRKFRKSLPESV